MTEKMNNRSGENSGAENNERDIRLSKRLAYILRYGAEKEGLLVREGGWVNMMDLTKVPMLKWYNLYQLMKEIINSRSHKGTCRYEKKHENGQVLVRAVYGRRMERNPCHNGTQVCRLLEICMNNICNELDQYDLEDFPDEYLIKFLMDYLSSQLTLTIINKNTCSMIHKLRQQKRLNNKAFRRLLCPVIEHLDLGSVYITEGTIKLVGQQCPNLKLLIMRDSGYLLTDNLMQWLLKRLPLLECLNIACCHHLTDQTINALCKNCEHLQQLNISGVPKISQEGILKLVTTCPKLHHLDMFDNGNLTDEGKGLLKQIVEERNISLEMKGMNPSEKCYSGDKTGTALQMASVGNNW